MQPWKLTAYEPNKSPNWKGKSSEFSGMYETISMTWEWYIGGGLSKDFKDSKCVVSGHSGASLLCRPWLILSWCVGWFPCLQFLAGFNWNGLAGQSLPAPWLPDRRKIQAAGGRAGMLVGGWAVVGSHSLWFSSSLNMRETARMDGKYRQMLEKPVCPEQGNESLMDDPTMEPWQHRWQPAVYSRCHVEWCWYVLMFPQTSGHGGSIYICINLLLLWLLSSLCIFLLFIYVFFSFCSYTPNFKIAFLDVIYTDFLNRWHERVFFLKSFEYHYHWGMGKSILSCWNQSDNLQGTTISHQTGISGKSSTQTCFGKGCFSSQEGELSHCQSFFGQTRQFHPFCFAVSPSRLKINRMSVSHAVALGPCTEWNWRECPKGTWKTPAWWTRPKQYQRIWPQTFRSELLIKLITIFRFTFLSRGKGEVQVELKAAKQHELSWAFKGLEGASCVCSVA